MIHPPCIVCGQRPHDGAYHERFRHQLHRWQNLLSNRYPTLRGRVARSARSAAEKPPKNGGQIRTAHRVSATRDFLDSVGRIGGRQRQLLEIPDSPPWRRLQRHLALEAPLRPLRRKVRL